MSLGESMNSRSFEVRCARCDVSFPVETKRCIHCGGSTGAGRLISFSTGASTGTGNTSFGTSGMPDHSAAEESFESAYGAGDNDFVFRDEAGAASSSSSAGEREEETEPSPLKSLVRSMGGVIWILLLVGFSLVRSCGGE